MFEIGDKVVFGTDGVCVVDAVGSLDIEGVSKDKLYYTLTPLGKIGNNHIFAPVESKRVVMRRIISLDEAKALLDRIHEIEPLEIPDERKREDTYKAALQSCDCTRIIQLLKEIHSRRQERNAAGKKLPSVDERYYTMAENALCSELSFPLGKEKDEVKSIIVL